jgi:putative transposase
MADMAQLLKGKLSKFINQEKFYPFHFKWQAGYGVFSVSHSNLETM